MALIHLQERCTKEEIMIMIKRATPKRNKQIFIITVLSLVIASLGITLILVKGPNKGKEGGGQSTVDVAIYTGPGTWEYSITAMKNFLEWKGLSFEEINAWEINHGKLSDNKYKIIFMPGGWADNYRKSINDQGNQNIREFVANGGGYTGMSAGAYYAADYIIWEGEKYEYPLDLFKGYARGPISEIAPWPEYVMTTINMEKTHEINQYEPPTESVLYYGEPVFEANSGQPIENLAYWNVPGTSWAHKKPAIIAFPYENGRVILFGPHPEIEENSERDGNSFGEELDDEGSDWPLLWTSFDWLLQKFISQPKELPGTNSQPSNQ